MFNAPKRVAWKSCYICIAVALLTGCDASRPPVPVATVPATAAASGGKLREYTFTLHWRDAKIPGPAAFNSNATPFFASSDIGLTTIDGEEFIKGAFYKEVTQGGHEIECEILLRRSDERTIVIDLNTSAPVRFHSDREPTTVLKTVDGKEIGWGTEIEPGKYRLHASQVEP